MKKFLALTLALVMVLAFAACSKAPASNETGSKTWIIAMDTVFRPFEYTDENGEFVGIDVDIINAVAKDQGLDIEIKSLGWDAAIAACQAGQIRNRQNYKFRIVFKICLFKFFGSYS